MFTPFSYNDFFLNVPVRTSDDKRHFPIGSGKTSRAGEDVLRKSEIHSGDIEVALKQPASRGTAVRGSAHRHAGRGGRHRPNGILACMY